MSGHLRLIIFIVASIIILLVLTQVLKDTSVGFPPPLPRINCTYTTADELLRSCPTLEEQKIIRRDFNISFEREPPEWDCTDNGNESSIMLSFYNTFRLMKCIPFNEPFVWAPRYNNLYEWVKNVSINVHYFTCSSDHCSNAGSGTTIYLLDTPLGKGEYREAINSRTGNGIAFYPILLAHEVRHTIPGGNKPHTCGTNDGTLHEMGAWAVQYYLLTMFAHNTSSFFSPYERDMFRSSAQHILNTRFCELQ